YDGARRLQTLKAPLDALGANGRPRGNGGLQDLMEFESEIDEETPNLALISDDSLKDFFSRNNVPDDLEPVFTTEFDRRSLPLKLSDSEIELAIDTGRIVASDREEPLCEAELELLKGRPERLFELALMLLDKVPFRLERRSKAARGYSLYQCTPDQPVKAARPSLERGMPLQAAFGRMLRAGVEHMRANETVVMDGRDPGGVHQMRVAIRRLRALASAFKPVLQSDLFELMRGELRWMQQQLGPARDWDVFIDETLAPLMRRLPGEDSLRQLHSEATAMRDQAYEQARAAIGHPRYTDLLLRLELWLGTGDFMSDSEGAREFVGGEPANVPVDVFARRVLNERDRKLRKLGNKHDKLSEAKLHKLRIQAKKVRYASDFFGELFEGKGLQRYLKRLAGVQDTLGSLNDAVTGQRLLDQLHNRLTKHAPESRIEAANGLGIVLGWQAAQIEQDLALFPNSWSRFKKARRFWTKA
ncbi:MAG: CHAD domain-containing protein, partial [Rhodovibrionaceae bacterium]|nr:CHAD domain-containing protein [Rhodovibrionaceae bacterium]